MQTTNVSTHPMSFPLALRMTLLAFGVLVPATLPTAAAEEPGKTPEAQRIRAAAPDLESPLFVSIRDNRLRNISPTWEGFSPIADAPEATPNKNWTGVAGFGTPVFIDDQKVAILADRPGSEPALWHLGLADYSIRCLTDIEKPRDGDREYDECVWHRVDGDLVAELIRMRVGRRRATSFEGESWIIEINLRTGQVTEATHKARERPTKENLQEKLLENRRSAETRIEIPPADESRQKLIALLGEKGVAFDERQTRLQINAKMIGQLSRDIGRLMLTDDDVSNTIAMLQATLNELPTSPATRDLAWQLRLAAAVVADDVNELEQLASGVGLRSDVPAERAIALRNLAAYQQLRLVSDQGDVIPNYQEFVRGCDGTIAARDAAILRMHEIGFHAACQMATVDAFDEFIRWAPNSLQFDDAVKYAESLESERIAIAIATADDADSMREKLAKGLYVDWRQSVRVGETTKAERCFRLLGTHPELTSTMAAVQAQDTKDEEAFRKTIIRQNEAHTSVLRQVATAQQIQLGLMSQQLEEQRTANRRLGNINSQLDNVQGQLSYIGQAAISAADSARQSADDIRDIRDELVE